MKLVIDQQRELIRQRLADLGMTQSEMAKRIGRTEKHVSRVLTGKAGTAELDYWALVLDIRFVVSAIAATEQETP
jgi:transcriptional regulator with XRE-family HTH domain